MHDCRRTLDPTCCHVCRKRLDLVPRATPASPPASPPRPCPSWIAPVSSRLGGMSAHGLCTGSCGRTRTRHCPLPSSFARATPSRRIERHRQSNASGGTCMAMWSPGLNTACSRVAERSASSRLATHSEAKSAAYGGWASRRLKPVSRHGTHHLSEPPHHAGSRRSNSARSTAASSATTACSRSAPANPRRIQAIATR